MRSRRLRFRRFGGDELLEMMRRFQQAGVSLELEEANTVIMAARAHWFEEAETAPAGKE